MWYDLCCWQIHQTHRAPGYVRFKMLQSSFRWRSGIWLQMKKYVSEKKSDALKVHLSVRECVIQAFGFCSFDG